MMCSGALDERGAGVCVGRVSKQMGGGPGFDVRITSPSEGQPRLDLELYVSWNAGVNSLDSCLYLHPLRKNTNHIKNASMCHYAHHISSIKG